MDILTRVTAPTPPFFTRLRNIGLVLSAVATALLGAPVALPAIVAKIAGYIAVAGAVAASVSQTAVGSDEEGS
ncbi:MAG: hypothetical protein JST39_18560 [Bacteroidetes bacterium]|nr:hypothetical protein [Bacteroidota bacterium]